MKSINLIVVFFSAIALFGCVTHPDKIDKGEKIFNEVKNADEIFGLFDLKLGSTTIEDLKKSNKSQDYYFMDLKPDYSIGVYRLEISDIMDKMHVEENLAKNQRVKQYYFNDYKYNELSVSGISLFFLDNILVGIHVEYPGQSHGFYLIGDFIKKYGDGIGKESWSRTEKWNPKWQSVEMTRTGEIGGYEYVDGYRTEERVWKNSKIEVKYDGDDMIYKLIDRYDKFDMLMKEAIDTELKNYNESKGNKIKTSI